MTTSARQGFRTPLPYSVWLAISAGLLVLTQRIDPYVFGYTAFGVTAISALLIAVSIFHGRRAFAWTCASNLTSIAAFALLSTYTRA